MFVETITTPRDEWEHWNERLRMLTEPPAALIASITWQTQDGNVTSLNVWETPEAVADFFIERVRPFVEVEGSPETTPTRHGEPIAVYLRGDRTA
jgi:hypothetical protein